MKFQDVLFCPTVPHTGTGFLIDFLRHDPAVQGFTTLRDAIRSHGEIAPGLKLVHSHFDEDLLGLIKEFAEQWPTVISLRDPLLAVLTGYNRDCGDYTHLVEHFVRLVEMMSGREPVYLPLDLMGRLPLRERVQQFVTALAPLENLDRSHRLERAYQWPSVDSRGEYSLKALYSKRKRKMIQRAVPREWNALVAARPVLQPFLEARGYEKLLWWG